MNAELLLMFTLGCDRAYLYGIQSGSLPPMRTPAIRMHWPGAPPVFQRSTSLDIRNSGDWISWSPKGPYSPSRNRARDRAGTGISQEWQTPEPPPNRGRRNWLRLHRRGSRERTAEGRNSCDRHRLGRTHIARQNAAHNGLPNRIVFHETDLLAGIESITFDLSSRTHPTWAYRKKTRCNLKSANLNPGTQCLRANPAWTSFTDWFRKLTVC